MDTQNLLKDVAKENTSIRPDMVAIYTEAPYGVIYVIQHE